MLSSKTKTLLLILKLAIIAIMGIVAYNFYDQIPTIVPTHRGIDWKADNWGNKNSTLFSIPLLVVWMIILFYILPKLDPKKQNYEKFDKYWEIIQFTIIWFFAYLYFVMIYIFLHPEITITKFMLIWLWIMFIILWNYMWKIRRNYFVWIKTPWTIDNEQVWNKTSRLWWWCFVLCWIVLIIQSFANRYIMQTFIVSIVICVSAPIIYSYYLHKKIINS